MQANELVLLPGELLAGDEEEIELPGVAEVGVTGV